MSLIKRKGFYLSSAPFLSHFPLYFLSLSASFHPYIRPGDIYLWKRPQFFKLVVLTTILPCFLTSSQQRFWTLFVQQQETFPWSLQRQPTVFSDPSCRDETSWVTAHIIWEIKWWWEHKNSKQTQLTPLVLPTPHPIRHNKLQKEGDSLLNNVKHYRSIWLTHLAFCLLKDTLILQRKWLLTQ